MVSQIEPAIVIEGNELNIRAQNWPAYCPVTIRLDNKTIKPARIALGTRNGNEILPDAMGNFVCMLSTVDLKQGKHLITLTTHYEGSNNFEGTFEVVERLHPLGERDSEFPSNENEESESWYLRELDFYNRRFKTIGFIPDNIRSFQLEQVKTLREIEKAKLTDSGNNTIRGPITGGCNWNPTGSGPIVVHKRWPG